MWEGSTQMVELPIAELFLMVISVIDMAGFCDVGECVGDWLLSFRVRVSRVRCVTPEVWHLGIDL